MKTAVFLQLAALGTAFVIPDEQVLANVEIESRKHVGSPFAGLPTKAELLSKLDKTYDSVIADSQEVSEKLSAVVEELSSKSHNALDDAIAYATRTGNDVNDKIHETWFDAQAWYESAKDNASHDLHELDLLGGGDEHPSRHGGKDKDHDHPPHHGPKDPHHGPPHHGPPHHGHGKPNETVWELISTSKYTTKLTKLLKDYPDLVKALNSTSNITVFAPSDRAFEKIPEHAPKPSKEVLKAILSYHVSPDFYPAGRILVSRTIPTLLKSDALGAKPQPQRLSTNIGFKGLTVNFYSRVVAPNIFGTNGVIHGVDSIIIPPPSILKIVDLLPSEFSTFELALGKTGFYKTLNETKFDGKTVFAPSNFAFRKLGPRINAFLFSSHGLKYLEAILKYHVVPDQVLYSDAYYHSHSHNDSAASVAEEPHHGDHGHHGKDGEHHHHGRRPGVPKGLFHANLPTLLDDRSLSVDVARYGRLIEIKINGFARVDVSDGVARDGVIHVVGNVLIPPKQLPGGRGVDVVEDGAEMSVEELVERLEPFVVADDAGEVEYDL